MILLGEGRKGLICRHSSLDLNFKVKGGCFVNLRMYAERDVTRKVCVSLFSLES